MQRHHFENVSRLFAQRRRQQQTDLGGTIASQDATPIVPATPATADDLSESRGTLFVQSFTKSTVTEDPATTDGYRVTLSGGMGQTIIFGHRPNRDVAVMPQDEFLRMLPFPDDNPPNAALLTDRGDGQTDLAIVELRNPVADDAAGTVTYDLLELADWRSGLDGGITAEAVDLATLAGSFGATHLFIDDCGDAGVSCSKTERRQTNVGLVWMTAYFAWTAPMGYCYSWSGGLCFPCNSNGQGFDYWTEQCRITFPEICNQNGGMCHASDDYNSGNTCNSSSGWCSLDPGSFRWQ